MSSKEKLWAYDIETFYNCFTVVFYQIYGEGRRWFVILDGIQDETDALRDFIYNQVEGLIGFNNLGFDSPVMKLLVDKDVTANKLYQYAQDIIGTEGFRSDKRLMLPELDLYKLWHFDNHAKSTSLKWLQCHLKMDIVEDMPLKHTSIVTIDDIDKILHYNGNDAKATKLFYLHPKTQELIKVRKDMNKQYPGSNFLNLSNSAMGEKIFMLEMGEVKPPLPAPYIDLSEVMLPIIRFKTPEFQTAFSYFKRITFDSAIPPKIKYDLVHDGMVYTFGLGGLHAVRPNTEYENVTSVDVQSYYPRLGIVNKFRPRHLGSKFTDTYDGIFNRRALTTKGSSANLAYKETLNSAFGKSNSPFSPLYDPMYLYLTTINGQFLLAMLCEAITRLKAGKIIMANTDGIEAIVYDEDLFMDITTKWQELTKLKLEGTTYRKLLIRDVNNYIGITDEDKPKTKGAYEVDKDFHKDPSARIVPLAIQNYMLTGQPVAEFIRKHDNLFDFFMYLRAKTGDFYAIVKEHEAPLPKTIRYTITKKGFVIMKRTEKKKERVHSGTRISIYNDLTTVEGNGLDILNRNWYIKEAEKLLHITKKEAELF